jgi:hypothetical protein
LSESAIGLEVLNTRTNGYRDIRLIAATARDVLTGVYKFKNGKYTVPSNAQSRTASKVPLTAGKSHLLVEISPL